LHCVGQLPGAGPSPPGTPLIGPVRHLVLAQQRSVAATCPHGTQYLRHLQRYTRHRMLIHACLDAQVVHGALGGRNHVILPLDLGSGGAARNVPPGCSRFSGTLCRSSTRHAATRAPAGSPSDAGGRGGAPASEIDACAKASRCNRYEPTINASGVTVRRARAHTHTHARTHARTHGTRRASALYDITVLQGQGPAALRRCWSRNACACRMR
jgi:hypothetical protein